MNSFFRSLTTEAMALSIPRLKSLLARAENLPPASSMGNDAGGSDAGYSITPSGVAIIQLNGVLVRSPSYYDDYLGLIATDPLLEVLADATDDSAAKSISLDVDSPGGFISGTVELANAVAEANKKKKVTAIVRGLCCSGAYWICSQAEQIITRPESECGNIGVYSVLMDSTKFYSNIGLRLTLVASGQFKGLGADGKVTQDLIDDAGRIVFQHYGHFVNDVASGRDLPVDRVYELADGKAFLGPQAKALGLVDQVMTSFEAALDAASRLAGNNEDVDEEDPADGGQAQSKAKHISRAEQEWAAMGQMKRETFILKEVYVAARTRELREARDRRG